MGKRGFLRDPLLPTQISQVTFLRQIAPTLMRLNFRSNNRMGQCDKAQWQSPLSVHKAKPHLLNSQTL